MNLHVLMITSEWPTPQTPYSVPFIVRQVEFLTRAGVNVNVFHFRGAKNPWNYLQAWYQVQKRLDNEQYDLIHAQWGQSAFPTLPKRIPLVVTFRGDDVYGIIGQKNRQTLQGALLRFISRCSAILADERIVVSIDMAARLNITDYHVIPSGIDLNRFKPIKRTQSRLALGLPDKDLVLFVGDSCNPRKRFSLIQEAVALAQSSNPNIELISVANIPHTQVPLYMNACDVLVLASVHEGSPNVVKEALACNLPVVSTDVGDVRERIGNINGCVVCEDDRPETIANALTYVLSIGTRINGRQAVQHLDEQLLTQKVIRVYQEAIEAKTR